MSIDTIILLAAHHLGEGNMVSSARLCLGDAIRLNDTGFYLTAKFRALKSLAYSVGIMHPDYISAKQGLTVNLLA